MAVVTATKHANFIGRTVQAAQQFVSSYNQLVALRAEWDSLAYSTAIIDSDFSVPGNMAPCNGISFPYLNATALQAFFTTEGNLVTFWTSGNGMNIETLIP